jgi:hypothetical protein
MTELCGVLWLPSSTLTCTLDKGHVGMHHAKYFIEGVEGEAGEMWWNGEFVERFGEKEKT